MIRELSELGKRLREENSKDKIVHDALKDETIGITLTIKEDGTFISIISIDKKKTITEAIQRTNEKKPRLLVDNLGYVLGFYNPDGAKFKAEEKKKGTEAAVKHLSEDAIEKNRLFVSHLKMYSKLKEVHPVILFYEGNAKNGIKKIKQEDFLKEVDKKDREGNIAFLVQGDSRYLHENKNVYQSLIESFELSQQEKMSDSKGKCQICSSDKYPVGDIPHYAIRGLPGDKEPAGGRKLVSYNGENNPYESYGLKGNENSYVCSQCAKTYVEGLNWLLSPQGMITSKNGKEIPNYPHRKNFGSDTAMVFWTRNGTNFDTLDLLDEPDVGQVSNLIHSVVSADTKKQKIDSDQFYSCTLSGAAARIAIRDWIEKSLFDVQASISQWFKDIAVGKFDYDQKKMTQYYSRIYDLARATQNDKEKNDVTLSRVAVSLWKAALENKPLPVWILTSVLKRIKVDNKGITPERTALIRLLLNRNNNGGIEMAESLDEQNNSPAYISGRIFCVLENVQRAALGKTNAGIRERFFSSASTNPSSAFGRLLKMSQNHISKIKGEKPGLAVIFDKELQELFSKIDNFPTIFKLEEQGQFAIGYYHQKNETFRKAAENKELKDAIENNEEKGEK